MAFNENNEEVERIGESDRTAVGTTDLSRRAMILGSAASVALMTVPPAALALESQPASVPDSPTLIQGEENDGHDHNERWCADLLQGLGQQVSPSFSAMAGRFRPMIGMRSCFFS